MKKEDYINLSNKYFKNKEVKKLFLNQIDLYSKVLNEVKINNIYKLNDNVLLKEDYLIHGTNLCINDLLKIKQNGLLAVEFYDKEYPNQKKPYMCEFWHIKQDISLKEYLDTYTESTIIFKNNDGKIMKKEYTKLNNLENIILNMKDKEYRDWNVYQTKESRFLPNKYNNKTIAFIINTNNNLTKEMLNNSLQSNKLNENVKKKLLPKWYYEKYAKGIFHNYDEYETDRELAIIFGLPSNIIEGILVNNEIEKNQKYLKQIKELFPNSYVCNLNGKVIY